ncbi:MULTISPECIES: DUF1036 domain-containing protein [unclassified Mesorhizobium]|uniref:DUF1036 domain-containing protein n=1 Tax=unclassified Mesorhizobium TaxID=325217 RepID=UPI0030155679
MRNSASALLANAFWTCGVLPAFLVCFGFTGVAHAQFAVCNQTIDAINVSVAKQTGGTFGTEGWWTIGANRCVDVIKEELTGRYVYVYATDVFGQPILTGDYEGHEMCIGTRRFSIQGTDSCWQRGYQSVRFRLVDTKEMSRWTFFLKDPEAN